ncbi:hypothetical protein BAX94_04165 [Elizabethkingia meningoseptica]|uniref:hypothetical protein n=1 Tax=Elizabethkingia meningoseptica TaxID=238 RepID=UPI000841B7C4|nr:hypothetical protein [Elizabethkingia meningoseptica]MDE5448344.1 hypothetical protein [Elizabethkingia meningoseptica]MDE5470052.1 hypothetical protein [Elizabethkingia meningoseptica]MDE5518929.1 hypothetical protein [Elizabethkingia meningoseptica]MDE5524727.1 hypothetical protein [Elizabethkingia meningoseptica]ODM51387.1 hypothetical protein BES09_17585 [Elizabethkingia meningoseptica]
MKSKFLLVIIITSVLTQCKDKSTGQQFENNISNNHQTLTQNNTIKTEGELVIIPDLKVEISLSNDAIQKLQDNKESVITSLLLYGSVEDEDTLPEDIRNKIGPDGLRLGLFEIEEKNISGIMMFDFNKLTIPKNLYDKLINNDFSFNINVFSGRRHFKDNILNMESYDAKLSTIISKGNKIKLSGHLIPEAILADH